MALGAVVGAALTTPQTAAQSPFFFWINGVDRNANIESTSYQLNDPGGAPATLVVTMWDPTNTVGSTVNLQDRVLWYESADDRVLFQGFVKNIKPVPSTTWAKWQISCADITEVLDFTPVIAVARPTESDQGRIQSFLATVPGITSQTVAILTGSLETTTYSATTVRAVITEILTQAVGGDYYMDQTGKFTTYTGTSGPTTPYAINNDAPNGTTTISGDIAPEYDGWSDVDAVYVLGQTQAGTGLVFGTNAPRDPLRVVTVQSQTSVNATTKAAAAASELARRQGLVRAVVTVEAYDGWARGQVIQITDSRIGWSARAFVVQGVTMAVTNQTTRASMGYAVRKYTLVCGAYMPHFSTMLRILPHRGALTGPLGGV